MVNHWQPGVDYNRGDVVEFEGARYRVIQGHSSQSNWTPGPNTEALWGRIPEDEYEHHHPHRHEHDHEHEYPHEQQKPLVGSYQQHPTETPPQENNSNQHYEAERKADIPHEEHKKRWWDSLTDDKKKQLEIGGVVAGVAALGVGYYAFRKHEQKGENKRVHLLTEQSWLDEAKTRTEFYRQNGAPTPLYWVLVQGHNIPPNAFVAGDEGGKYLYFCRAYCDGGIQVGKAGLHLSSGAAYGYAHKTHDVSTYEILVGDSRAAKWVPTGGKLRVDQLDAHPVEGGIENNGTPVYLARVEHHGHQPGKVSTALDAAYVAYGNEEVKVKEYSVLCYV